MIHWTQGLGPEIVGAPVEIEYLGPALWRPQGSVWVARVQSAQGAQLALTVDLALAIALVDAALGDPRGPGRRVRPLGELEHGLLLAQCAQVLARLAAAEPDVHLTVVAEPPGLARLPEGELVCHRVRAVCNELAGLVCLFGAPVDLPGPTVVVLDDALAPGDLVLGSELGAARPAFPAYILGRERQIAQWVDTQEGRALRVLGRG